MAAYFSSCNRNKYSVAVDFKTKEGLASHVVLIVLMAVDLSDQVSKTCDLQQFFSSLNVTSP